MTQIPLTVATTWLALRKSAAAWPALAAALVFVTALGGSFQFDDWHDIVNNEAAHAETFWSRVATTVRPLLKASYALQDAAHGPWPAGFVAVNILLHLATASLLFVLVRRLLEPHVRDANALAVPTALAVTLWAVHPAATETVTYISGRSEGLSSALLVAALVLATGPQTLVRQAAAFACALLAPLARETALILPALLIWIEIFRPRESWRGVLTRMLPVFAGASAAVIVLAVLPSHRALIAYSLESRSPLEALRGNIYALQDILYYWLAPWRITIDPVPSIAFGWTDWETTLRVTGLLAAIAVAIILRKRAPPVTLAIGWTLLSLVPTNSILWRSDPVALKPLYLASIGFAIVIAWAGAASMGRRISRAGFVVVSVAIIAALGAMTSQRNLFFASPVLLWQDAVAKTPESARPWLQLAIAFHNAGREAEAREAVEKTLEIEPWNEDVKALRLLLEPTSLDRSTSG